MLTYLKTKEAEEVSDRDLEAEMRKKYPEDVVDEARQNLIAKSGHTEEWEIGDPMSMRFFYLSPEKRIELERATPLDILGESKIRVYKTATVEGAD